MTASPSEPPLPPSCRASWIGSLRLGEHRVAVKAYPAAVTPPRGPLRRVHAGCGRAIEHQKCCPVHGPILEVEIGHAYPVEPDLLRELTPAELASLEPEDDGTIAVDRFPAPPSIDLAWLSGRCLHLVPAHPVAAVHYGAIVLALRESGVWGDGTMVLSGRRRRIVVEPLEERLRLHVLHRPVHRRAKPPLPLGLCGADADGVTEVRAYVEEHRESLSWTDDPDDRDLRLAALVRSRSGPRRHRRRAVAAS